MLTQSKENSVSHCVTTCCMFSFRVDL
uniref:Uncharacterized protein n=1 Tax=Anguilla anguilla TaxID=7936 RepID=A0A0E9TT19_ANGAN